MANVIDYHRKSAGAAVYGEGHVDYCASDLGIHLVRLSTVRSANSSLEASMVEGNPEACTAP